MSVGNAGPGRIYAWITGLFADSDDPTIVHYFTAQDVVNASVYSIGVAVLLTLFTWGPLPPIPPFAISLLRCSLAIACGCFPSLIPRRVAVARALAIHRGLFLQHLLENCDRSFRHPPLLFH